MGAGGAADGFIGSARSYLNNASVSLLPTASLKAMTDFLVMYSSAGPDSAAATSLVNGVLRSTRRVVAKIIGCRPEELVLTQSVTDGINMVSGGLQFPPRSNIILRGMAHEHHANYYPWLDLAGRVERRSLAVDGNGFFDLRQLREMIDENTKLVTLSHALYNTGAILPIEEVGELLEGMGVPFLVDAAQTVGCVDDLDVSSLKCNFMSFNGSKWLCGPMGTGLFYCRRDSVDMLRPARVGGESAMVYDGDKLFPKEAPDRFQAGFRNYVGMAGLEASVRHLLEYGMQQIRQRNIGLADMLRDRLAEIPGVTLYGPEDPALRTSIVPFSVAGHRPKRVVERLEAAGIILAEREILDEKVIRASPHFFNTEEEVQSAADAIRAL